jgi:hypothetical protein
MSDNDEIQRLTEIERITNRKPSYLDNGRGILRPHVCGHNRRAGMRAVWRHHHARN